MQYGFIRKVSFDRGFGFIEQERGSDVYFHATNVAEQAFDRIMPDQAVKFELEPRKEGDEAKGLRAKVVHLLDRMPGGILQPAPTSLAKHHPKARQRKPTWRKKTDDKPDDSTPPAEPNTGDDV